MKPDELQQKIKWENFKRYLKNTTIYSYKDETWNRRWSDYSKIIKGFNILEFVKFIENIMAKHKISNEWNISKNIYAIYNHAIKKLKITDHNQLDIIKNVFISMNQFLKKVIWKKIDEYWLVPDYDNRDGRNVYCTMWNEGIKNLFWKNKYINKIRETRNKFIEHYEEYENKDKSNEKYTRRVELKWIWDNIRWEIKMDLMDKNGKKYRISICPLFDFCIFINELAQIKTTPPSLVI